MVAIFKRILSIIPKNHKKKSIHFLSLSLFNVILDLISIAYLIPIFILILDPESIPSFFSKFILLEKSHYPYIAIAFIFSFALKNIIQIKISDFQIKLIFDIASDISSKFLNSFLHKNYLDFQKKNTAQSIQNIKIVGSDFSNYILLSINTFLTETTIITVILSLGLYFYLKFTLLVILVLGFVFMLLIFFRKRKIAEINNSLKNSYSEVTSRLLNIIQGFIEVKSLKKEDYYQTKFDVSIKKFNNHYTKLNQYRQSNSKYLEILIVFGLTLFLLFISNTQNSIEHQIFFISFIAGSSIKLLPSINKLMVAYTNFQSFKYTIDILKDINHEVSASNNQIISFENKFTLKDISFHYDISKPILKNINLTIQKGDFIGISGVSGAGKTTLLNIMMNLIYPTKGSVFVDNKKISEKNNLFDIINYLPQHPFLFEGSILDNIIIGQKKSDIDFTKIQELSIILELDDLIKDYIHKELDINSLEISGGQKQRIALLRTLYHDFEILILDEATNQLNEELENKIFNYLLNLKKEHSKTIISVSHNPLIKNISNQFFLLKNRSLIPM